MRTTCHWINGRFRAPHTGQYLTASNPATGQPTTHVALGGKTEAREAVEAAASAQPSWAAQPHADRARILTALGARIRADADELTETEVSETGKLMSGMPKEIHDAADYFDFYGGAVRALFGKTIGLGADQHAYTTLEPYGVVAMITPWNSPLLQAARGIAPALAAGNAVVIKPSEFTPSSTARLAQLAADAGLPDGVLNVVTGTGPEAGTPLVAHPAVRKLAFTGSVETGRVLARACAARLIPVSLELGGKSPNVVFADADLDRAAASAAGFTRNCGQVCSTLSRLIVEQSVHDELIDRVLSTLKLVTPGDHLAPITTPAQFARVQSYFAIAAAEGARLMAGGTVATDEALSSGNYLTATVYTDVAPTMRIFQEEIFGPVLTVTPFETEEDAIHLANATAYGLIASIWTSDVARAHRVAAAIDAGQVSVNGGLLGIEVPFGGYKNSGIGREKGFDALYEYTQVKTVVVATGS